MIRENNEMIEAHDWSFKNMDSLKNDKICGCFYCCEIFKPSEIEEYIEERDGGRTAVCPRCGIDSVIGELSGFPITKEFLTRMKRYWFDGGTGYSLKTPFGVIKLLFDGKEEFFDRQCVDPTEVIYPDVDVYIGLTMISRQTETSTPSSLYWKVYQLKVIPNPTRDLKKYRSTLEMEK